MCNSRIYAYTSTMSLEDNKISTVEYRHYNINPFDN